MKLFFTTALALVAANALATAAANDDVELPQHTIGLGLAADLVYVTADKVDADVDASSRQSDVNANLDKVSAHCFSERVAVHTEQMALLLSRLTCFLSVFCASLLLRLKRRIMHLNTCVELGLRKRAITRVEINQFIVPSTQRLLPVKYFTQHHLVLQFIRAGIVRMVTCIVVSKIFALLFGELRVRQEKAKQGGGTLRRTPRVAFVCVRR